MENKNKLSIFGREGIEDVNGITHPNSIEFYASSNYGSRDLNFADRYFVLAKQYDTLTIRMLELKARNPLRRQLILLCIFMVMTFIAQKKMV